MKAKRTILLGARWKFVDFKGRFNNALSLSFYCLCTKCIKNLTYTFTKNLKVRLLNCIEVYFCDFIKILNTCKATQTVT